MIHEVCNVVRHYATKGCDSKVYFASYTPVDRCLGDSDIDVSGRAQL